MFLLSNSVIALLGFCPEEASLTKTKGFMDKLFSAVSFAIVNHWKQEKTLGLKGKGLGI